MISCGVNTLLAGTHPQPIVKYSSRFNVGIERPRVIPIKSVVTNVVNDLGST